MSTDVEDPRFPGQLFTVPEAGLWKVTAALPLPVSKSEAEAVVWRPRRVRRMVTVYLPGDWPETTETVLTFDEETDL